MFEDGTCRVRPGYYTPVSYTHLDVYKRQSLFCRLCRHAGKPYRAEAGGKDTEREKGAATAGACLVQDPPCPGPVSYTHLIRVRRDQKLKPHGNHVSRTLNGSVELLSLIHI